MNAKETGQGLTESDEIKPQSAKPGRPAADPQANARYFRARARETEVRARTRGLKLKILRGEYVLVSDVRERDIQKIAAVRDGLLALPRSVAHLVSGLPPREVEALLDRKVRDLLDRFARMSGGGEEEGGEESGSEKSLE